MRMGALPAAAVQGDGDLTVRDINVWMGCYHKHGEWFDGHGLKSNISSRCSVLNIVLFMKRNCCREGQRLLHCRLNIVQRDQSCMKL